MKFELKLSSALDHMLKSKDKIVNSSSGKFFKMIDGKLHSYESEAWAKENCSLNSLLSESFRIAKKDELPVKKRLKFSDAAEKMKRGAWFEKDGDPSFVLFQDDGVFYNYASGLKRKAMLTYSDVVESEYVEVEPFSSRRASKLKHRSYPKYWSQVRLLV